VVWLSLRSGVLAGSVTVLVIGIAAAVGTARELGPFFAESVHFGLIQLWGYIATLGIINLIVCALVSESAESQQRLRALFEHSRDAILLTRPDGPILAANPAACALFGMSESEFRARGRSGIVDPDDARRSALLAQRDAAGSASGVVSFVRKDGSRFEGEVTTTRYENEGGEHFGHVILRDVTERQRTLDALARSEERLRLALEGGQMGAWDWDARSDQVHWDDQQCHLLGVPCGTTGSNASFNDLVHVDDRRAVVAAMQKSSVDRTDFDLEFRVVRPDGAVRWLAGRGRGAYDESGQLIRMYGVNYDITDRRRAQEAIVEAETARRASLAKSEFLSRMSHELRTPLNAVLGFAQILRLDPAQPLSPKQLERVRLIEHAGDHQLAMINDVLDLSVIESGSMSLTLRTVDACSVVQEATGLVHIAAQTAGITMSIDTPHEAPLLARADPIRLRQVVTNLLTNAIKYNHRGGRVDVTCGVREGALWIAVADTGRGLTPAQVEHLFEPFNRLGAERSSIEGTGIGLVIARRLMEQMHGRIEVDSVAGQGARFTLWLPLVPAADADAIASAGGSAAGEVPHGNSVL
jgi:PAS domain S-box-containing protein